MLNKDTIEKTVQEAISSTDTFLVEVKTTPDNKITVYIDRNEGMPIDECMRVSRFIESKFDREEEDFELQVSSPGLTQSFKVLEQYEKNKGKDVRIVLGDGTTLEGTITSVADSVVTLEWTETFKEPGKKKKQTEKIKKEIDISDITSAKPIISF